MALIEVSAKINSYGEGRCLTSVRCRSWQIDSLFKRGFPVGAFPTGAGLGWYTKCIDLELEPT